MTKASILISNLTIVALQTYTSIGHICVTSRARNYFGNDRFFFTTTFFFGGEEGFSFNITPFKILVVRNSHVSIYQICLLKNQTFMQNIL